VDARREGKWIHYRLVTPSNTEAARLLNDVRELLANDKGMQRDRKRLVSVCCAVSAPATLQAAPKPASLATL
jgi:ArsR family transcriptional regulator